MVSIVSTVAYLGLEARSVEVQCQVAPGMVGFAVVGLPDKAVAESRERVRAAISALGLALPPKRITINLSPADLPKEGSHYDLPIALALLGAMGLVDAESLAQFVVVGELGLDGRVAASPGVLLAALHASSRGLGLICPAMQGSEAAWAGEIEVVAAPDLLGLLNHLKGQSLLRPPEPGVAAPRQTGPDLKMVKGQETAKRALEIAAAGGHNLALLCRIKYYAIHGEATQRNNLVTRTKAYSYIRMSTADQAKGDSTRRQDKATQKYAEEHDLELVDILIDEGVSAFAGMNVEVGKLGGFLAKAEKREIDEGSYLIVESLDRISRETVPNALLIFQRIINSGIKIVTLFDRQIYSKKTLSERPYDLLMAILTLMRGHEESQVKSIRLKASWENKREIARNGKNTRHVIPKWLCYSDASARIEAIPERAVVVKEIFGLSCAGMGAYSIAKKLNISGYKTWGNAKFWQESYIKKILHNRAVLGEFQPHILHRESNRNVRVKIGEPISDYYPAIIDENLFLAAENSARQRLQSGKGRKGKTLSNLFSGLIFCRHCGSSMRFMNKGASPKGGTYIRCSNSILTGKCQSRSYGYPIVEALVIGKLRQLDMKKIQMDSEYRSQYSDLIEEKLFLETKLSATEEAIDYFMQLNDLTQLHQVAQKLIALQSEKETFTNSIIETNKLISDISVPETDINTKIQAYLNGKFSSDAEKLLARTNISHTIKSLLTKIEIYEEKIFPWDEDSDDNLLEGVYLNLHLYYRNGASQIWYGAKNSNLYMPPSEKMNLLKRRSALSNRD